MSWSTPVASADPVAMFAHLRQPTSDDPVMLRAGLDQFVVDELGEDRQHGDGMPARASWRVGI